MHEGLFLLIPTLEIRLFSHVALLSNSTLPKTASCLRADDIRLLVRNLRSALMIVSFESFVRYYIPGITVMTDQTLSCHQYIYQKSFKENTTFILHARSVWFAHLIRDQHKLDTHKEHASFFLTTFTA